MQLGEDAELRQAAQEDLDNPAGMVGRKVTLAAGGGGEHETGEEKG